MDERPNRGPVRPEPADDVSSNSIGSDTASRFPFNTGNFAGLSADELDDPAESLTHPDRAGEVRSPAWTAEPAVTPTPTMPAALAAIISQRESPTYQHRSGSTPKTQIGRASCR